jgi:UDP-glucose 4-epimerase
MIEKVQNVSVDQIGSIDGIFHLAAQASVPYSVNNFFESSKNNILSSLKVFEWAKNQNIPVVYASSSAVYGNLAVGVDTEIKHDIISPYAQDKLTVEHYAAMIFDIYNVNSLGLRLFNVYGPRQDPTNPYSGVISIFIDRMLNGNPVTINGGFQTRDFIYVQDVVNVMIKSMELLHEKNICEYFNVGTGQSVTIDELFSITKNIMNTDPEVIRKILPHGDPERSDGSYTKIKEILGVDISSFIDLQSGLIKTFEYFSNKEV